jgi:hypothetical protein
MITFEAPRLLPQLFFRRMSLKGSWTGFIRALSEGSLSAFVFFCFLLLLVYINDTKRFHCGVFIYAYNVLGPSSPLCYSFLSPLPPDLNSFNRFHCSVFIHVYKVLQSYSPFSPSLFAFPFSTGSHPKTVTILHSCHSVIHFFRSRFHI